jgi:hypothetical protein
LNRRIEVQLSGFDQLHHCDGRDRFRERGQAIHRVAPRRQLLFDISEPVAFGPNQLVVLNDGGGERRRVALRSPCLDRRVDLCHGLWRKTRRGLA